MKLWSSNWQAPTLSGTNYFLLFVICSSHYLSFFVYVYDGAASASFRPASAQLDFLLFAQRLCTLFTKKGANGGSFHSQTSSSGLKPVYPFFPLTAERCVDVKQKVTDSHSFLLQTTPKLIQGSRLDPSAMLYAASFLASRPRRVAVLNLKKTTTVVSIDFPIRQRSDSHWKKVLAAFKMCWSNVTKTTTWKYF